MFKKSQMITNVEKSNIMEQQKHIANDIAGRDETEYIGTANKEKENQEGAVASTAFTIHFDGNEKMTSINNEGKKLCPRPEIYRHWNTFFICYVVIPKDSIFFSKITLLTADGAVGAPTDFYFYGSVSYCR
jgi:hypothetical protein